MPVVPSITHNRPHDKRATPRPRVTDVLRQAHGLSHAAKLVLLAITAYMEEHGSPVYPSQATIAKDSGVTERYIEACVQECEQAGYLQVERRRVAGKRPRNFYTVSLIGHKIPEASSGKPVRGSQFPETPSVEKKERKDLKDFQEHTVRGSQFPEPGSPNLVRGFPMEHQATEPPDGAQYAAMLASMQVVSTDFAQVLQGKDPDTADTRQPPQDAPPCAPVPPRKYPFDAKKFRLGGPCTDDPTHRYGDTGQSLRFLKDGACAGCVLAAKQAALGHRDQRA